MINPTSQNPLGRGPTSGRAPKSKGDGLAARVEANLQGTAPPPKGKGVVMLILAAAVVAAVIIDFARRGSGGAKPADEDQVATPALGPQEGGPGTETPARRASADTVETIVPTFPEGTPEALQAELGPAIVNGSNSRAAVREPALRTWAALVAKAPAEMRAPLRDLLLGYVEQILTSTSAKTVPYETAAQLASVDAPFGASPGRALRRLTSHAELALDDSKAAASALLFLTSLPGSESTWAAVEEIVIDGSRNLALRVLAASQLPDPAQRPRVAALASAATTPKALKRVLQR